ncbi:MFS transporter [Thiomonas intermedia]|uniref:MFS transporter n=1 Tax=Thiomonas intermedia TaxID=926 RepID=UPI0009A4AD92|nr:MFS transporter [Thiomonas intermedia]
MNEETKAPAARALADQRWVGGRAARVLLCVSGVSFMIMLDANVVAVSLPAIARGLGSSFADIEWVVSSYLLAFAACLMPMGALADRFGRRRLLLLGLALFTFASLLCGMAPNADALNAARALQGVGAALQLSAALAVLGHEFRGANRARAFAFWGTVIGVAVAVGPLVGGAITASAGWRWVFFINVPIGAGLLALGVSAVEESSDPDAQRMDLAGMVLFGSGLFSLIWGMIDANVDGWGGHATLSRLALGAALLVAYVVAELVQVRPMVDFALFRQRTFLGSSIAMLGFAASAQVMLTYLPLYLQNAFGFGAAAAGLRMMPFALPLFIFPRVAAALATRVSGRGLLTAGLLVTAAGNAVTAWLVLDHAGYLAVAAGMALTGCGAGLLNGETAKVSMSVIPPERAGMASGIGATLRFTGLVTGITALGAVLIDQTRQQFAAGIAAAGTGVPRPHAMVSHIVAGDMAPMLTGLAPSAAQTLQRIARDSFAGGFSTVLAGAAGIALVAALASWALISAVDTSPHTHHHPGSNS